MVRYGFIHSKEDIKFLTLYAMGFLPFPVNYDAIIDICTWCDNGFGYFELSEAFYEMVETGHVKEIAESGEKLYEVTEKGREAAELFERRLPSSVRKAAQTSALRVTRKIRRDAAILVSSEKLGENDYIVHLAMDEVFKLDMNVVSEAQVSLLQSNFRANAEKIYQTILSAMIADYHSEES